MTFRISYSVRRAASNCGAFVAFALVPLAAVHAQQTDAPPPAAETAATPQRFTLKQSASARQIIDLLLSRANVPFVIGPDVTGDVTVQFTDLTLNTALDRIAQSFSPPLAVSQLKDGTYIIKAGEKGPTRLALSTPPASVTIQQQRPPTTQPISVSVVGGDPVSTALELQIIALRVDREIGAKYSYGPSNHELLVLGARIIALEKQLALHKEAKKVSEKTIKTAQLLPQRAK